MGKNQGSLFWKIQEKLLEHPYRVILFISLVTLFFAYITATRMQIDNDVTKMIPEDNPVRVFYEENQKFFGNSSSIAIVLEAEGGIFSLKTLKKIQALSDGLEIIDNRIKETYLSSLMKNLKKEEIQELLKLMNEKSAVFSKEKKSETGLTAQSSKTEEIQIDESLLSDEETEIEPEDLSPENRVVEEVKAQEPSKTALSPEENLQKLLQNQSVLMEYFQNEDTRTKINQIASNQVLMKKITAFWNTPSDKFGEWFKKLRKIQSLTKMDFVSSRLSNPFLIEDFFIKNKIDGKKGSALCEYFIMKGFTGKNDYENFRKSESKDHTLSLFGFTKEEIIAFDSLDDARLDQLALLIKNSDKLISVSKLIDFNKIESNPLLELFLLKEKVRSWELYSNFLYSGNPLNQDKMTMILGEMVPSINFEARDALINSLEQLLSETLKPEDHIRYYLAGEPVVTKLMGQNMVKDLNFLSPIVIVVIALFLFLSFRHFKGVFYPLITVIVSVIWILGTIFILGFKITIMMTSLPVILLAVGSAYGIHIIHHYYEEWAFDPDKKQGIFKSLKEIGFAVVMAGITTVIGFASMAPTDVVPLRDFGIFTAIGTIYALVIAMILIPALLKIGKNPKNLKELKSKHSPENPDRVALLLEKIGNFSIHHKKTIFFILFGIIAFSVIGTLKLKVEMNPVEYFKAGSPIRISDSIIVENFAGTSNIDVILDTGKKNGILDYELLKEVEQFQNEIEARFGDPSNQEAYLVGKIISINSSIKKMNQAMNYGNPEFYRIPDEIYDMNGKLVNFSNADEKKEQLKAVILNYIDKFSTDDTRVVIDSEKQRMKVAFTLKTGSTIVTNQLSEVVYDLSKKYFKENENQKIGVSYTGNNVVTIELNTQLLKGQIIGIFTSIILVFLLVWRMQRSFVLGLISIVPLVSAVLIGFGLMGFTGVRLEISTGIIANIAIGIGIDYVIHYINGYILYRKKGHTKEKAIIETTGIIGEAVLINAVSVALGFLVLLFASFTPLINTGWLLALAMMTTALGALVFIPVLINLYKKDFPAILEKNEA